MKISVTDVAGRSARDVMHPNLSTLPPQATLDEVEAYFAESTSRRLATVVDEGRYVGAIDAEAFAAQAHPEGGFARDLVHPHPTVGPDTEAAEARDLALATASRRVPVVDDAGTLLGVVAIDKTLTGFCS